MSPIYLSSRTPIAEGRQEAAGSRLEAGGRWQVGSRDGRSSSPSALLPSCLLPPPPVSSNAASW